MPTATPTTTVATTETPTPTPAATATETATATATATPPTATPTSTATATEAPASTVTQTFSLSAIPLSNAELPNPLRGQYQWYDQGSPGLPSTWPVQDSFWNYDWSSLESGQGVYNFSDIDARVSTAASRGGRFGFMIMAVNIGCTCQALPQYLINGANSWAYTFPGDGYTYYIPDWNNSFYLSRWQALNQALAARYGNDPRVNFIQIGGYGDWSEWHSWPWNSGGPNGQARYPSTATFTSIIHSVTDAFPNKIKLMLTDAYWTTDTSSNPLDTALSISSTKVGLTNACIGDTNLGGDAPYLQADSLAMNRWKTAPFGGTTWCDSSASISVMAAQVPQWHISSLGGGGGPDPSVDPVNWATGFKNMGYRIQLDSMTLPVSAARGASFTVASGWENVNVAPSYLPWNVLVQLRTASGGTVVWQGQSSMDLRTLLPTGGTPVNHTDTFTLPTTIAPGTYTVAVQITDPDRVSPPLALATTGRTADGSYTVGTLIYS